MQFLVLGYDGKDDDAINRRLAARDDHLNQAKQFVEAGQWLYAAAILDEEDKMVGSMIVCDFPSRKDLDKQWLNNEPYISGKVWQNVVVTKAAVPPFILDK
ncbi:MAG: hypothetical protein GY699_06095 [Desulfobacteraceae bacterium]|nr:hypothetical protein [Desulfobacteraceae bacterium]